MTPSAPDPSAPPTDVQRLAAAIRRAFAATGDRPHADYMHMFAYLEGVLTPLESGEISVDAAIGAIDGRIAAMPPAPEGGAS
jgi:hypothetical protein